jgi:hypothetical protein
MLPRQRTSSEAIFRNDCAVPMVNKSSIASSPENQVKTVGLLMPKNQVKTVGLLVASE